MEEIFFIQPDWQLFTNLNTLPQQAGVNKHLLPKLAAKELTDNALDTNEKVDISHFIDDDLRDIFTVKNYGEGFIATSEEIAKFFSIRRPLTSSKRWRMPSRGALGNGLRVVVGTIYCLKGELFITTHGKKWQLIPQDNGFTEIKFIENQISEGTTIQMIIPENPFAQQTPEWAELALKVNQGKNYLGKAQANWYDSDSFYNLLMTVPKETNWNFFLQYFENTSAKKAQELANIFLENQEINRENTENLLGTLREKSKIFNLKKLGEVSELKDFDTYHKKYFEFEIKASKGKLNAQIPSVIEVFIRKNEYSNQTQFFVNKSPIISEINLSIYGKQATIFGSGLNHSFEIKQKINENIEVWLSIITPYMPIISNGKAPDFSLMNEFIIETLQTALGQFSRKIKKEQKLMLADNLVKVPTQKEVVLEHLKEAIKKASGEGQYRYSLRQLYYVLRPFVFEKTGRELRYTNFNGIITFYEHEQGKDLEGVYRDERGTLLHPHTQQEIKLGTRNVEKYQRPVFNFNKILYSEKEGFFEILKDVGFCEKYDCALLTSKGFASRAARDVIDLLAETEEELLFFCIHDADLSGTLIYQALQGATLARPERKVKIINLGLEPWEGLKMKLEVESLEKKSRKNAAEYLQKFDKENPNSKPSNFDLKYFQKTWEEWLQNYRIELNAMDTPTFVKWLEKKIQPYHKGKVVPDENYLKKEAEINLEAQLKNQIQQEILEKLNIEKMILEEFKKRFPEKLSKVNATEWEQKIKDYLKENPQKSWNDAFFELLEI